MNRNKLLVLTSLLCLLPIVLSIILYTQLPAKIAIHWDSTGVADRYVSKAWASFGIPLLFLAFNIIQKMIFQRSPRYENASKFLRAFSDWAAPVLSLVLVPTTLYISMGVVVPLRNIATGILGIILVFLGNYLPKNRQNYSIGIRIPWTLHDDDNWNKTHRFAGYTYIAGGIILILSALLLRASLVPTISHTTTVIVIVLIFPRIYSFALYRKSSSKKNR